MTLKKIFLKSLWLLFFALAAFVIHATVNNIFDISVSLSEVIYSYTINLILAYGVIYALFLLKRKLKDQLGFVFMVASLLKFVAFFILFYPQYNSDGDLSKLEFFTFFIPYAVCLSLECVILAEILGSIDTYN